MVFSNYINKNYNEVRELVKNLISNTNDVDDLLHSVIEQLLKKDTDLSEEEWVYFLIRIIKNNYYSKNSRYYYEHKKPFLNNVDLTDNIEPYEEEEDVLEPSLEWVYGQLQDYFWYDRDLFILWLELGTITQISSETKIPYGTVGKQIRTIKQRLINEWDEYKRCNDA